MLTHAKPVVDDLLTAETVGAEIGVLVPFLDANDGDAETDVDLMPETIRLQDDGSLHVTFGATVGRYNTPSEESDPPDAASETKTETDSGSESVSSSQTEETATAAEEAGGESRPKRKASTETVTAEPRRDRSPLHDSDTDTSRPDSNERASQGEDTAVHEPTQQATAADSEATPPYQDSGQLAAVYDEYDTFAEMRDALDVDVTPQTVRRYRVEHEIHEPAPTTESTLS